MNTSKPNNRPGQGSTKTNMQRQIRTAGTNRPQGNADHLHRGDQRDRQPQK